MRMELVVDLDDAARLPRSKLLVRPQTARPRYRPVRIVWHDSPDRQLQTGGLALEERRGLWRLERLTPGNATWLPGQAPPELAQAKLLAELDFPLPDGLIPIASFEGRLAISELTTAAGPVTMELLRGTVGATPVARLTLDGDDAAVRDLALGLAGEFGLSMPRASLAADAIALGHGETPPPRHLGAPAPSGETTVPAAFGNAIGHFTDVLQHFAPLAAANGPDTEPVHQMRVATRRARSAIAVFRHGLACPDVLAADRDLKALGAVLGPARDWDVFVTETLPRVVAVFPDDPKLRRLAKAAQNQQDACHTVLRASLLSPGFRQLGIGLAWLCASQSWHATLSVEEQVASAMEPAAFAAHVLQRRWRKVAAAGKSIKTLDVPALHALRLRAKRARYAMEIFLPSDGAKSGPRLIRRLGKLQQHLGTLNDGAVAAGLLDGLGGPRGRHGYAVGLVLGFLAASASSERPRILRAWKKCRRTSRFWARPRALTPSSGAFTPNIQKG